MLLRILLKTFLPFALPLLVVILVLTMARGRFPFLRAVPTWIWALVIIVLVLAWVAVVLIRWIGEKKRAAAIEKGILKQAQWNVDQAAPGRRAEIEELRKNLGEAMALLRQGPEGKKALYTLPWYMIIGPPAIGKTTAIVNSGLNFPNMTTARRMRGAGGTRNCDWWFSTDAILLDTAGRYAQSLDRSETEGEWFGFLDLLKKQRSKGPINGLILGYSIETLLQQSDQGLIDDARELRQRMDETLDHLGWTFPVYVLFTKCDLVAGFADYFSSLTPAERQQVWGATFEPSKERDQKAAERFTVEFDSLLRRLRELRARRVAGLARSEDWGRVFMFPEEFAALRSKLQLFIETLFETNPFRKDAPLFRGAYFSSGKQMGQPFDLVLRKVRSMLGLGSQEEAEPQEEKEDAYFVRDLFAKVLKGDRDLIRRSHGAGRKMARFQVLATAGLAVLSLLACLWIGVSYGSLRNRVGSARSAALRVVQSPDAGPTTETLAGLEQLRGEVEEPWAFFPLTAARDAYDAASRVYLDAARGRILAPIEDEISHRLDRADRLDADQAHQALLAEVLLTDPKQSERLDARGAELATALAVFGFPELEAENPARAQLTALAEAYLRRGEPVVSADERRRTLLAGARRLAETHDPEEFFDGMVAAAGRCEKDLTLEHFVGEQRILTAGRAVRAAFTRAGWDRCVSDQLDQMERRIESDDKLIVAAGSEPSPGAPTREDLLKLYQREYPREWAAFFESVRLSSSPARCADAVEDMRKLASSSGSPLLNLFRKAASEAELGDKVLGRSIPARLQSETVAGINDALRPLTAFVAAKEGAPSLDAYAEKLDGLYQQVADCAEKPDFQADPAALRGVRDWPRVEYADHFGRNALAAAITNLLESPTQTVERVLGTEGATRAGETLKEEVIEPFKEKIAGKYPFGDGEPASVRDVTDVFGPSGMLATFVKEQEDAPTPAPGLPELRRQLDEIRRVLNVDDSGLYTTFKVTAEKVQSLGTEEGSANLRKIDSVVLTINGVQLVDRLNQTSKNFTWSTGDDDTQCSVSLMRGTEKVAFLEKDGVWAFFQLWDEAKKSRSDSAWRLTWSFPDKGVEASFLVTMRDGAPPFRRESPFRSVENHLSVLSR